LRSLSLAWFAALIGGSLVAALAACLPVRAAAQVNLVKAMSYE
jgi:ABC-type antimicrobial peptide transport system permease subunit